MLRVPASQFVRDFGRHRNIVQREAVVITTRGRDDMVLLSAEQYKELSRPRLYQASELTYQQLAEARRAGSQ